MLDLINLCTSSVGLFWLTIGSDFCIAVAYFAIPITMAIVLRDRKDDIPYPWLWLLFVTFIVACGLTHTAHIWSAIAGADYPWLHAAIGSFTALVSVGTAIAFALILPQIKMLPSPAQQRVELERLVTKRTHEKDELIREINHRIGNQLQILSSIVSIETRRAVGPESFAILGRLRTELNKMGKQHIERSMRDYLPLDASGKMNPETSSAPAETPSERKRALDRRIQDQCDEQDQPGIAVRFEQA